MAEAGEGFGVELEEAGRTLEAFANGPARAAGEALEQAFAKAGRTIRGELQHLAKTGEADLDRLSRAIVETLAKLAVERLTGGTGSGASEGAAPVNVTMNFSGGASGGDAVASSNQIAAAVARAVRRGARFT